MYIKSDKNDVPRGTIQHQIDRLQEHGTRKGDRISLIIAHKTLKQLENYDFTMENLK